VAVAVLVAVTLSACSNDDGDEAAPTSTSRADGERREAQAWSAEAERAYTPLDLTALELPGRVRAWLAGQRTAEELAADLAIARREVETVEQQVGDLRPFPRDPDVQDLYLWSTRLYVAYVDMLAAALASPAGDVRTQLELAARRLRILGDRVFDRGQARLKPFLHEQPNPDIIINLPPDVPDWILEGMAAGPPLDDPPPPPAPTPELREETRPTQPRDAWVAAVKAADPPSSGELLAAIDAADPVRLRDLARRFDSVARALRGVADPDEPLGREEAAQVGLGLLVYAEAARAAQAGQPEAARRLVAVGDGVATVPGYP
jgi:hypothetical protein